MALKISDGKSWNCCTNVSSNHDLLLNHQLKKCHSILHHWELNFIGFSKQSGAL